MARIVLVGAGHTHIELARCGSRFVRAGHELVLISPEAEHAYSGMGPGMLGGTYSLEQIQLPAAALMQRAGGVFMQGTVTGNDPAGRTLTLSTGETVGYDLLSINAGSELAVQPGYGQSASGQSAWRSPVHYPVKPILRLAEACARIEYLVLTTGGCRVAVVGGGPAGVELAGNAAWLLHRLRTAARSGRAAGGGAEGGSVDLYASGESLAGLRAGRRRYVENHLRCHGVRIHYGQKLSAGQIADGLDADVVLIATGIRPSRCLETFGLPVADDGAVCVDDYLRSVDYGYIFAVGDSAHFVNHPLDRVGVYAVRMQRVLIENLLAAAGAVENPATGDHNLIAFTATGNYLGGLNLGFDRGILYRGRWELRGRPAFLIKDAIDRRFMGLYQRA